MTSNSCKKRGSRHLEDSKSSQTVLCFQKYLFKSMCAHMYVRDATSGAVPGTGLTERQTRGQKAGIWWTGVSAEETTAPQFGVCIIELSRDARLLHAANKDAGLLGHSGSRKRVQLISVELSLQRSSLQAINTPGRRKLSQTFSTHTVNIHAQMHKASFVIAL